MKLVTLCLALAALGWPLPSIAQTSDAPTTAPPKHILSSEEIAKLLSSINTGGHNPFPLTPQEKARVDAGMAKSNELDQDAKEALHNKNFVIAEADYRELVEMGTLSFSSYYGLGESLAGQGKTAEAIAAYKVGVYWPLNSPAGQLALSRAGDNRPNLRGCCGGTDAVAWLKYALLLSQTGQNAEAFSVYSQAILWVNDLNRSGITLFSSADPSSPAEFQAAVHIALGLLTGGMLTDPEQAMTEFDHALQLAPDAAVTNYYYGYGWNHLDLKSATRAVDAAQAKAALAKAVASEDGVVKKAAGEELKGLH